MLGLAGCAIGNDARRSHMRFSSPPVPAPLPGFTSLIGVEPMASSTLPPGARLLALPETVFDACIELLDGVHAALSQND